MADEFLLQRIGGYSLCGRTLGKGAFARVELGIHRMTNNQVALKIINLNNVNESYVRKNILRESAILKNLRHDNIVRLYETLAYKTSYCFVMEYLEGGDLQSYIREQKQKKLNEKQARKFFTQLMIAIEYLHCNGIIHRDLKLQNIMLTENKSKVKLVDFGLSNFFDKDNLLKTQCGSAEYAAPELFDKGVQYGPSVELWSSGVILFGMTTGKMPFEAQPTETKENLVVQIRRGINISHENILKKLSANLKDLLICILEPDKGKRITLHEMFAHAWVTEDGKKPLLKKPPEVLSHEIRQKVIDQVAKLYCQPVGKAMQQIRMNHQHSMVATYKILMDKATKNVQLKNRSHSTPSKYFNNMNSHHNKKYESIQSRPKSARPERRTKSTLENKKDIKFHLVTCAQRETYECAVANCTDASQEKAFPNNDVQPISSCLKITRKVPAIGKATKQPGHSLPSRSPSPSTWLDHQDDDLKQTPFRMSPPPNHVIKFTKPKNTKITGNHCADGDGTEDSVRRCEEKLNSTSDMTKTTIEGEFELETKSGNNSETQQKVDIGSENVNVSFTGEKLRKGSFKITEWKHQDQKGSPNVKVHTPNKKAVESKVKSNIRCISPNDARRMLHRDTFPLRKKSVEIKKTTNPMSSHRQMLQQDAFSHRSSQKPSVEDEHTQLYEAAIQNEIIAAITQSPDTYMKNSSSTNVSRYGNVKHLSRCTFENAQKILLRESYYRPGKDNNHVERPDNHASSGSCEATKRKVSFKD